jgi:hypothetical protein
MWVGDTIFTVQRNVDLAIAAVLANTYATEEVTSRNSDADKQQEQ